MRTGKFPRGVSVSLSVHYKHLKISEQNEVQPLIISKAVKYLPSGNKMSLGYICVISGNASFFLLVITFTA